MVPAAAICAAQKRLSDEYLEAVRDLGRLHEADAKAIIAGEHMPRVDIALRLARRSIETTKIAYLRHVREHGC